MRRRLTLATTFLALTTLAACGTTSPTPGPSAAPTPAPTSPAPSEEASSPAGSSGMASPGAPPSTAPAGGVIRDDSLLAILPADLDGIPVTAEDASFAEAAKDPAFASYVERAAFAVVAGQDDLASGVVAQLVPDVFDEGFFQDWRETYNEGACAQAGGVVGNAEAEMDGRTVYITTCGGGLRVYHAYVEERGVLVSLFSLGEGRFGERLMAGLRP